MSENTLSGRWHLVSSPAASPGCCVICGKADHSEGFVDGQLDFEFYGTLYFCIDCARELGRVAGCLDHKQTLYLKEENERLSLEAMQLMEKLAVLEGLSALIRDYASVNESTYSSASLFPAEGEQQNAYLPLESGESRESEPVSVSSEQGSNDIPGVIEPPEPDPII